MGTDMGTEITALARFGRPWEAPINLGLVRTLRVPEYVKFMAWRPWEAQTPLSPCSTAPHRHRDHIQARKAHQRGIEGTCLHPPSVEALGQIINCYLRHSPIKPQSLRISTEHGSIKGNWGFGRGGCIVGCLKRSIVHVGGCHTIADLFF